MSCESSLLEDHPLVLSDFSYGRPPNLSWKPFMVHHPLALGDLSYGGDHPLVFEDHCYGRPPSLRRPILTETTTCLGEYFTQDRPLVLTGFLYEITLMFWNTSLMGDHTLSWTAMNFIIISIFIF